MNNIRPSLKINAISNWASLFVQIAVGFFLTPFIISHIGKSGYGIWVLVGSFIGYYGLLNMGVGSAITRYIARYSAQNDIKSLNETANTALVMFCITGLLAILASFLIAEPLARFLKITSDNYIEFKHLVWILGISTGLSFPSGVFSAMITARERYVAVNIVNILVTLVRTGLTVAILLAGHGLAGIAYPTLAATVISIVAFVSLSRQFVPEFRIQPRVANFGTLKTLLVYGGYTTIMVATDILRFQIDSIVIGRMVSMADVGIYGVAALLIQYMLKVITAGMGVLTPRFAALDFAHNKDELKKTFLQAIAISSFLACGICLIGLLFGGFFIRLWVGSDFYAAASVLSILLIGWSLDLSQNPGIGLMLALNKHKYYAAATFPEAIANITLSILLAPHYGIIGVALGTAIPMIFVKLFIQPIYVSRIISIRLRDYAKAVVPAFAVLAIILFVHSYLLHYLNFSLEIRSYTSLFFFAAATGTVYCSMNYIFSNVIKKLILSLVPRFH